MTRFVLLAVLAATAGCTDLPEVEPEGCGNLVLNAEEDCDGFSDRGEGTACGAPDTSNACFFVCSDAEGMVCPTGWGCGLDGRCRRPSGSFEEGPGSPWRFRVGDFAVGDVDGDGHNDLVGNDVQSLTVRFGADSGDFASDLDVLTPQPFGPLTFGIFDADALLDVLVPVAGGLFVLLGDEERSLEPVAYSPIEVEVLGNARIFPVEADGGANLNSELLVITANVMQFVGSSVSPMILPGAFDLTDLAGLVPVAEVNQDAEGRREFALAFSTSTSVWVYTSLGTAAAGNVAPVLLQEVALPLGARVDLGAQFADFDGDGWNDLFVSVRSGANRPKIAVAVNNGAGGFGAATVRNFFDRGTTTDAVWPLAIGNLGGDQKADYVFPDFIAITDLGLNNPIGVVPLTLTPTQFITDQQWTEGVLGEFNGDANLDVATVIEGRDGVDVFLNVAQTGIFNKFHIDTDDPPRNLRAADYDGDFIQDIAVVESGFGSKPDAVAVIFGATAGGPTTPVRMGSLGFVDVMEPVSSVLSLESIDAITDLFVLSSSFPERTTTAVALLQGSSSRRMLSPFTLQPESAGAEPDVPRRALFGQFAKDDEIADIIAISEPGNTADGDAASSGIANLWLLPGSGTEGQLDAGEASSVPLPANTEFSTRCAVWASGNLDSTANDEVIGIDGGIAGNNCFGFGGSPVPHLALARKEGSMVDTTVYDLPVSARGVASVELHDVDDDGDLDVLALFQGEVRSNLSSDQPVEGAAVVVIWNIDGALSLSNITEMTFTTPVRYFDVEPIRIDDTGIPALAILATGGVFLATLNPDMSTYAPPTRLLPQAGDGKLEVADLNGDGLDDLAYTVGDDVQVLLAQPATAVGVVTSEPVDPQGGGQ